MGFLVRVFSLPILLCIMVYLVDSLPTVTELRLSLADVATSYQYSEPEGPGTYAFGYEIDDPETENIQFRDEERRLDGSVIGKYGWLAADDTVYIVSYVADARGYRATSENIPNYRLRKINPFRRNRRKLGR